MTVYAYIRIAASNVTPSNGKKFKAIKMAMPERRTDTMDFTVGGNTDKQAGPVIKGFNYVLRVPQATLADTSFGTMSDLRTLFEYVNPNATPTDVVTITDHYGTTHACHFTGEINPEPLCVILEGDAAWHLVPVEFQEVT